MRLAGTKLAANHQYRGFGDQLYDLSGQRPSLDLNFSSTKSLVDATTGQNLVTFTRASSGTYVDSQGVIRTATANEARFDHSPTTGESLGLLVEEQRTNLLLQSEDFSTTWGLSTATVSTNVDTAPNGSLTADKLIVNNGASNGYAAQSNSYTSGTTYAFSVYVKAAGATDFRIVLLATSFGSSSTAQFNLSNGTVTSFGGAWSNAAISAVGNGWYRVSGIATATATASSASRFQCNATGDGSIGVLIWGAQLEAGAFPTSYIPTTTSAATRSADVASITGSNFSSWYRQDEGTFYTESSAPGNSTTVLGVSDGGVANRILLDKGTNSSRLIVTASSVSQVSIQSSYTYGTFARSAFGFALDNVALSNNGNLAGPDNTATIPTFTQIYIGANNLGLLQNNGPIKRVAFWPQRLSNSTLQGITQ